MQSAQVPKFDFAIIACSHHEIARNKTGRPELTGRTHLTQKSQIPGRNICQTTPSKSLGPRLWPNDKQHVQWESCLVQSASINFVENREGKKMPRMVRKEPETERLVLISQVIFHILPTCLLCTTGCCSQHGHGPGSNGMDRVWGSHQAGVPFVTETWWADSREPLYLRRWDYRHYARFVNQYNYSPTSLGLLHSKDFPPLLPS